MTGMAVTVAPTGTVQVWDLEQKVQGWIKPPHCVAQIFPKNPEQRGDRLIISAVCRDEWLPDVLGLFRAHTAGLPVAPTHTLRQGYTRADWRIEPIAPAPTVVADTVLDIFGSNA